MGTYIVRWRREKKRRGPTQFSFDKEGMQFRAELYTPFGRAN